MARLSSLLFVVLAVILFISALVYNVVYVVTIVSCRQGSTCPQGNLVRINQNFALNRAISPNLTLNVGDRLQFYLTENVSVHSLLICQNSSVPNFKKGATNSSRVSTPFTQAGANIAVVFTTAGVYY